jgi:hypothetical protein
MTISPLIIRAYCEEHLENIEEKGDTLFAKCPRCGKARKHWNIDTETGLFYCYRCNFRGTFEFLVKYLEGKWPDLDELQDEYESCITLDMLKAIHSDGPVEFEEYGDWTENTVPLTASCRDARLAREYLESRNVSLQQANEFQFRVAVAGDYKNYIIIPVEENGEVKSFVARRFKGEGLRYTGPSTDDPFERKSNLLWGLDRIDDGSYIVLVEGVFDALPLLDENAVALMGKEVSPVQIEKILDTASGVTVLLDSGFYEEGLQVASSFVGFLPVKVGKMKSGDPGENPVGAKKAIETAVSYFGEELV